MVELNEHCSMLNPLPCFVSSYLGHITRMCLLCCFIFHYVAVHFIYLAEASRKFVPFHQPP